MAEGLVDVKQASQFLRISRTKLYELLSSRDIPFVKLGKCLRIPKVVLRYLKKPVELVCLPEGAHELVKPWERMNSMEGNLEWFSFWLNGEKAAKPVEPSEYTRWRRMREQL